VSLTRRPDVDDVLVAGEEIMPVPAVSIVNAVGWLA
jgi:hypothetical protein